MRYATRSLCALFCIAFVLACDTPGNGVTAPTPRADFSEGDESGADQLTFQTVSASGDITGARNSFRVLLGDPNNAANPGPFNHGRREIDWDAVPAQFTNINDFAPDFFNRVSRRGAVFSTPGTGFRVSDNDFNDVNPTYNHEFNFFSPVRTFSQLGAVTMDVSFFLAGHNVPALVTGFGVALSDVDLPNVTSVQFFDANGASLGTLFAPVRSDAGGLSFIGRVWSEPVVSRVRITLGNGTLGATSNDITLGGFHDLVIMDDFLYGEPMVTP